jgi:predicted acetyltransferase
VAAALNQRDYRGDGRVVIEVADRFRPANDGRYAVSAAGCEQTDEAADLAAPVDSLGAAFLGGVSFRALAVAGRATELRAGGIDRADALFLEPVQPFCDHGF